MTAMCSSFALAAILAIHTANAYTARECEVRARTSAGWVCGTRQVTDKGRSYASFKGVPYAKQPLGELRFKELQPPEPWKNLYDARTEGFACPQHDVLYGPLMTPAGFDERCIHANIHVPIEAVPSVQGQGRSARELKPPAETAQDGQRQTNSTALPKSAETNSTQAGLPIFVFIHGGGFAFGSGDSDIHGPEYLVDQEIIVITFNYRLNVFGFLSLNTSQVPGNAGLRDMVTLLHWVRDNARNFGGDPDKVTLGGQSAGAAATHLLTLSPAAKGLFNKAIIMSGTAIPEFYATTPAYAQYISNTFVTALGITATDPDEIHKELINMPINKIMEVNKELQDQVGLGAFFPVIESPHPGVETILPENTEQLLAAGVGSDIPMIIGFTDAECQSLQRRFQQIDILGRIKKNPLVMLSPEVVFTQPPQVALERAQKMQQRYFKGEPSLEGYLKACSDMYFEYPALKAAQYRARSGAAPTYLYEFSYSTPDNPVKLALGLNYTGAGHVEDLAFIFKMKYHPFDSQSRLNDKLMRSVMTNYFTSFISYGQAWDDSEDGQLEQDQTRLRLANIETEQRQYLAEPTFDQYSMMQFFDEINAKN